MVMEGRELERELDPKRVRPAAVLGVLLVLCAVGWLAWRAFDRSPQPGGVSPLQQAVRLPGVWTPSDPPPMVNAVPPLPIPPSPPASVPAGYVEVCGVGVVKDVDKLAPKLMAEMEERRMTARVRVAALLQARGDDLSRMAGLQLAALGVPVRNDVDIPCTGSDCPNPPDRGESEEALRARLEAMAPYRDQVARLALHTRSASAYGFALGLCQGRSETSPACAQLSPEQWARLDPSDAIAWHAVANAAAARGDQPAVMDALYRASQAPQVSVQYGRLAKLALDAMPADVGPLEAFGLASELLSIEAGALVMPIAASRACRPVDLRDANRAQLCGQVAQRLVDNGSDSLQVSIGTTIGQRVGWPPERLAALKEERNAFEEVGREQAPEYQSFGCGALRANANYVRSLGEHGEVGTLRRKIAASGRSTAEWAAAGPKGVATSSAPAPHAVADTQSAASAPPLSR